MRLLAGCSVAVRRLSVAAAVGAVLVTAGCATTTTAGTGTRAGSAVSPSPSGVTGQTADALLQRAQNTLKSAGSVRVAGVVVQDGATTTLNVGYVGSNMSGTVTTKGFTLQLVFVDKVVYFSAPDGFWTASLGPAKANVIIPLVSGKWIRETSSVSGYSGFLEIADRPTFVDGLFTDTSGATKSDTRTINGVPTLGLELGSDNGTLYVATDDGRPIAVVPAAGATDTGEVTFSQYNALPPVTLPPASKIVDSTVIGH